METQAATLVEAVVLCANFLYELGNRISFLSTLPLSLRQGFQGLATKRLVFRVGERERAVAWISNWLAENSRRYVKLYDPYFDVEQLWILKSIPVDIPVTVGTTWHRLKSSSEARSARQLSATLNTGWDRCCDQEPPPTMFVVENDDGEGEAHDRYLVTSESGLSIGTSLNGMGNKEFTIAALTPEDARFVEEQYINPRIDMSEFTRFTFVRLRD